MCTNGGGEAILQVDTYPLTIYSAADIQELNQKFHEMRSESKAKDGQIESLKQSVAELKRLVRSLAGKK